MTESSQNDIETPALAATTRLARRLGLKAQDAAILYARHGLVIHLRPEPAIARVARTASAIDRDLTQQSRAAVELTGQLAERGVSIMRPFAGIDPGPHLEDGFRITIWELLTATGDVDPASVGTTLRQLHEQAADLKPELPSYDPRPDALALCDVLALGPFAQLATVVRRAVDLITLPEHTQHQPLHGDAQLRNVMQTDRGPVWIDVEDAVIGPSTWDLACLRHVSVLFGSADPRVLAALDAYGEHEAEEVEALAPAVMVWIAPWALYADSFDNKLNDWTKRRVEWLEEWTRKQ